MKISLEFWKHWLQEYLQTLQQWQKWTRPSRSCKSGDLILKKDVDPLGRSWPMAMVKNVHPGIDGLIRTVELQTIKGTYSRPIHKLVLLLLNTDQDSPQLQTISQRRLLPPPPGGCSGHTHIGLPRIPPHQEKSRSGQTSHAINHIYPL